MIPENWIRRLGHASCVALVLLSGAWVKAQQPDAPPPGPPDHEHADDGPPSAFWLGITCRPVDEALRAQLEMPEGCGLVVEDVAPESPAAAAELARHDILLKVGDQELGEVRDLMRAVDEAGRGEATLSIVLVRGGDEKTIEVKPAKRERPDGPQHEADGPADNIQELAEQLHQRFGTEGVRIAIPRPGLIVRDVFGAVELPEDVTITIEKHGREPGKVTVTRGEEKWEATEDDLAKLPEELRGHAERMLGKMPPLPPDVLYWFGDNGPPPGHGAGAAERWVRMLQEHGPPPGEGHNPPPPPPPHDGHNPPPPPPGAEGNPPPPPPPGPGAGPTFHVRVPGPPDVERMIDRRLEQINERLEKLQQAIEELRAEKPAENDN